MLRKTTEKRKQLDYIIQQLEPDKRYVVFLSRGALREDDVEYLVDKLNKPGNEGSVFVVLRESVTDNVEIKEVMTGQQWYEKLAKHLNVYSWTQDEKDSILQAAFEVAEGLDKEQ